MEIFSACLRPNKAGAILVRGIFLQNIEHYQTIGLSLNIFSGGFIFSLVDENNNKIKLGQSFGLLTAKRAGFSQVSLSF